MTTPVPALPMEVYLSALEQHRLGTHAYLLEVGYPEKLIVSKALKASAKGYADYGTTVRFCWINPEGVAFLRERGL